MSVVYIPSEKISHSFAGSYRFDKGSQLRIGAYAQLASTLGTSCLLNSDFGNKKNVSFKIVSKL